MATSANQEIRRQSFVERFVLARVPFMHTGDEDNEGIELVHAALRVFNAIEEHTQPPWND